MKNCLYFCGSKVCMGIRVLGLSAPANRLRSLKTACPLVWTSLIMIPLLLQSALNLSVRYPSHIEYISVEPLTSLMCFIKIGKSELSRKTIRILVLLLFIS